MDLENLEMNDGDLESWSQALFNVINVRTGEGRTASGKENILQLLPATKVKV